MLVECQTTRAGFFCLFHWRVSFEREQNGPKLRLARTNKYDIEFVPPLHDVIRQGQIRKNESNGHPPRSAVIGARASHLCHGGRASKTGEESI